jgi:hypothetical protein
MVQLLQILEHMQLESTCNNIGGGLNMRILLSLLLVFLLLGSKKSYSTPSTQIWIPSTDIQPFLNPHLGWDIYLAVKGDGLISDGGLTIGVLPFSKFKMEIGIDYRDVNGFHRNPILFNSKIGVPEDAFFKYMPALAVGIYELGIKKDFNNYNILYGLTAKSVWILGRFSLGGYRGVGSDELWKSSDNEVVNSGVIASWDRVMSEVSDKLWFAIDFQSGQNLYGALSFGAAWFFSSNVSLLTGYNIYIDDKLSKPTITIQIDINVF